MTGVAQEERAPPEDAGVKVAMAVVAAGGGASKRAGSSGNPSSGTPSAFGPGGPQWDRLREAIQRHVVYPSLARRLGWQGKVMVSFVLQKGGQPLDVRILESSGFATLDGSALQAVERAAPLPPPGEAVQIVMPIVFALR